MIRKNTHYNVLQNENFQLKSQYNKLVNQTNELQLENTEMRNKLQVLENPRRIVNFLKQQNAGLNREIINKNKIIHNLKNDNKFNYDNFSVISPLPIDQFSDNISEITCKSTSTK